MIWEMEGHLDIIRSILLEDVVQEKLIALLFLLFYVSITVYRLLFMLLENNRMKLVNQFEKNF